MAVKNAAERIERDLRIAEIPWVSRFPGEKPCDGIKWGQVALKHLYRMGGHPPEGIPAKARCKLRAKWHFTALRHKDRVLTGDTGDYCIHHLFSQIYDHHLEMERYQKWSAEQSD